MTLSHSLILGLAAPFAVPVQASPQTVVAGGCQAVPPEGWTVNGASASGPGGNMVVETSIDVRTFLETLPLLTGNQVRTSKWSRLSIASETDKETHVIVKLHALRSPPPPDNDRSCHVVIVVTDPAILPAARVAIASLSGRP